MEKAPRPATGEVERSIGIDLGLKDFAVTSDAWVITLDRHYRKLEGELAKAQRVRKKGTCACAARENQKFPERPVAQAFHGADEGITAPSSSATWIWCATFGDGAFIVLLDGGFGNSGLFWRSHSYPGVKSEC